MASVDKIINKMKRQPNGISMEEAEKVLEHYKYKFQRQSGSHKNYRNEKGEILTIPFKRPLKSVYVKEILKRIDE